MYCLGEERLNVVMSIVYHSNATIDLLGRINIIITVTILVLLLYGWLVTRIPAFIKALMKSKDSEKNVSVRLIQITTCTVAL